MPPKKSKKSNKHNDDWDDNDDAGEFAFPRGAGVFWNTWPSHKGGVGQWVHWCRGPDN